MTLPLPHIGKMSPYALADMTPPPGYPVVSLAQNESLRPPSPLAIAAAVDSLQCAAAYPDPDWTDVRAALADLHGVASDMILCGAGSLDLIGCLTRAYTGPGRAILAPAHAYPFFKTAAQMADARLDTATEQDGVVCVDSLLRAVRPDTALVCVANPGNPTGTFVATSELRRLRAGLRDDIILLIDEAYGEFADADTDRCWNMAETGHCVILRSFSKAYAMAGFRIGWGVFARSIAAQVRKVMNPNNVTAATQAAALAAVQDQAYMRETCTITAELRDRARDALRRAGIDVLPSVTNFLLLRFADAETALAADAALRSRGVFLRGQGGAALPHALRMTIGAEPATMAAVGYLEHFMQENGQ